MSRGPGKLQRELGAIFDADPGARLTTTELAARLYGTDQPADWQRNTVARCLRYTATSLRLTKCRVALSDRLGWRHLWGRTA